jgi:hypothetical protein
MNILTGTNYIRKLSEAHPYGEVSHYEIFSIFVLVPPPYEMFSIFLLVRPPYEIFSIFR